MQVIRQRSYSGIVLAVAVLMFLVLVLPAGVMAGDNTADKVRIAVQPGLSGIYKVGYPTGLNISVSNQGPELRGSLIIKPDELNKDMNVNMTANKFQKTIVVPGGGVIKTTLMVPGDMVNANSIVQLVVDGKVVAASSIQGTAVHGGLIALSLGEKPLRGGITAWLDQSFGGQTAIKYIDPKYLPQDALELSLADIIIVDEQSVKQLNLQQISLLKEWVALGGMMIISGGAGTYPGGPLAEISPVISEGQRLISADLGGLRVVKGNMQVTTGKLVQGEVLTRVNGVVVVASRNLGKGSIIYSGIPLEELTVESAAIWPLVLGKGPNTVDYKMTPDRRHLGNDMLGHVTGFLPQLQTPPVPLVALAWGIYVLVVGPVLYLILKRYDRRDWLWWMIPACAIVTTGVVYLVSPAQRINAPISQTLAVVEVLNRDLAEVNAAASFVSPFGGTLDVQGSKSAVIWPSNVYYNDRQKGAVVQYDQNGTPRVSFPNVEYWSMRQARTTSIKKDIGYISGQLVLDNGHITGKLENHTKQDLKDCRVVLGSRSISVGNLPVGGIAEINYSLSKWPVSLGPNEFREDMFPQPKPGQKDMYVRERQMVEATLSSIRQDMGIVPIFLGWSEESLNMFQIVSPQKKVKDYNLSLLRQELDIAFPEGKVIELPSGLLVPRITDSRGAYNRNAAGFTVYEGKLALSIDLEKPLPNQSLRVVSMVFPAQDNSNLSMQIYDWQQEKWVDIPQNGMSLASEELKVYSSPAGELRLQVDKRSGLGRPDKVILPAVSVEGVTSR